MRTGLTFHINAISLHATQTCLSLLHCHIVCVSVIYDDVSVFVSSYSLVLIGVRPC
jgi:hypothetical protein